MSSRDSQVIPRDLTERLIEAIHQGQLELSSEDKHHAVVGVALNNVLIPALKPYVEQRLETYYQELVHDGIDRENSKVTSKQINLFEKKPVRNISNVNEFVKLYLKNFMAEHFTGISDERTDSSVILNLLGRVPCFTKDERKFSNLVRDKVRNEWAHCHMKSWTEEKFLESFQLMERLSNFLPELIKRDLKTKLTQWQDNGIKLFGNRIDPNLLKTIFDEFQKTLKNVEKASHHLDVSDTYNKEEFQALDERISLAAERLGKLEERCSMIETDQASLRSKVDQHESIIQNFVDVTTSYKKPLPPRNDFFVGRQRELSSACAGLTSHQFVVLSGLGGVGKTSLAIEVAWQVKDSFHDRVYWLTADTEQDSQNVLKSEIVNLVGKIKPNTPLDTEVDLQVGILANYLREQDNFLLIIDNLDEFSSLAKQFLRELRDTNVKILITSRLEKEQLEEEKTISSHLPITLESFDLEDAVQFLQKRSKRHIDKIDAEDIVNELGKLPLALDQAAAYLKQNFKPTIYLEKLKKQKLKLLDRKKAISPSKASDIDDNKLAVQTTWALNMASVRGEFQEAEEIMNILSFLSPKFIPLKILNSGEPKISDLELAEKLEDEFEVADSLMNLTKMSLFERIQDCDVEGVRVHRLVQEIIRDNLNQNPAQRNRTFDNIQKMLNHALLNDESHEILENIKETKSCEDSLTIWRSLIENFGHFVEELNKEKKLQEPVFTCSPFLRLVDHLSLYYYISYQRDRATDCKKLANDHLARMRDLDGYKPLFVFDLPLPEDVAETLSNTLRPAVRIKLSEAEAAGDLKDEGDTFSKNKVYSKAVRAYQQALSLSSSGELRRRTLVNLCRTLYLSKDFSSCLERALESLKLTPDDPVPYLWAALSYLKVEKGNHENSTVATLEDDTHGELAYVYAILSLFFATENKDRFGRCFRKESYVDYLISLAFFSTFFLKKEVAYLRKFLSTRPFQRKIILSRSKVIPVTTNSELESAIKNSTLERCHRALSNVGERHIILLREGSENLLSAITHREMAIH